jgi:(E)-4-hydroxy-3-methylbut-2-enyl-diphosphate synthase
MPFRKRTLSFPGFWKFTPTRPVPGFTDTFASTNIGSLLCDGIGDAILVQGEEAPGQALRLSYNILQAAGTRIFKTDYVACHRIVW